MYCQKKNGMKNTSDSVRYLMSNKVGFNCESETHGTIRERKALRHAPNSKILNFSENVCEC